MNKQQETKDRAAKYLAFACLLLVLGALSLTASAGQGDGLGGSNAPGAIKSWDNTIYSQGTTNLPGSGLHEQFADDPFLDPALVEQFLQQFRRKGQRIVGGESVNIVDYPWQVSLQLKPPFGTAHFCGGSIVDKEWIVTASHCLVFDDNGDDFFLNPNHLRVRAGFTSHGTPWQGSYYDVDEIIMHPSYSTGSYQNDIALLRLSSELDFSHNGKAKVPIVTQADASAGMTNPGQMVKVSGWGALSYGGPSPDQLQAIEVPIVHAANTSYPWWWITADMIIAGADGMDSCQGDSGGPMVVEDGNGWYKLAGVVSWGNECGLPGYPGVYARVSHFESWLNTHLPDQATYAFSIEVFDENDNEIQDAILILEGQEYPPGHYVVENLEPGTYEFILGRPCYQDIEGEVSIEDEDLHVIYVLSGNMGDVNGDGIINAQDVILLVQVYLEQDHGPYCAGNADATGDGVLDVLDVIAIVNLFMNQ